MSTKLKNNKYLRFIYNRPVLVYIILVFFVYWPVSFLLYSLKFDMIDVTLPWRFFASEALQNQGMPLWNPYQQCGYPFYADLQYPIWYPEVFMISSIIRYSNYTLHFLLLFYIMMGGMGMFKLSRFLNTSYHYSLLAGIVYMLSGLFVGHTQSLVTIMGATWLPWVLAYYLKFINNPYPMKNRIYLIIFAFL
ncbi:MAG: hypothetical protein ABEH43_02470, partial [Flavobacteriales bacterium]